MVCGGHGTLWWCVVDMGSNGWHGQCTCCSVVVCGGAVELLNFACEMRGSSEAE